MAEPQVKRWTTAELEALPYDEWRRYEIVDGELFVTTAPHLEHQAACNQTAYELTGWNSQSGLGRVLPGVGLVFSINDSVQPDVVWVSRERLAVIADKAGHLRGAPELVVEVLSPGWTNRRRDRVTKLRQYSRYGVQKYWILDWRTRTVGIYRHDGTELRPAGTLHAADTLTSPLLPGFAVPVAQLFGR